MIVCLKQKTKLSQYSQINIEDFMINNTKSGSTLWMEPDIFILSSIDYLRGLFTAA